MLMAVQSRNPEVLGSAMFSVHGIHEKLKQFRAELRAAKQEDAKLYFAKVDVRACFDTLPQDRLVGIAEKLIKEEEYNVVKSAELRPGLAVRRAGDVSMPKKMYRIRATGTDAAEAAVTSDEVQHGMAKRHPSAILLDHASSTSLQRHEILETLRQHIQSNIIKMGKKFYRQKNGIAQGSILSTLLCSLCYADFEREYLGFLKKPFVFLRMIDDFLLVTTSKEDAKRFFGTVVKGGREYGIEVRGEKCAANLEVRSICLLDRFSK